MGLLVFFSLQSIIFIRDKNARGQVQYAAGIKCCYKQAAQAYCAISPFLSAILTGNIWYVASGLKMLTDTVSNATKMVQLVTRSFQAVAKLVTISKLMAYLKT